VLTSVADGGFDSASAVMSYHVARDEYDDPTPSVPFPCSMRPGEAGGFPRCSAYVQALYRQHAVSSLFGNFPAAVGHAQLANAAGYYVSCVSASEKYSGSVHQDGTVMLRFQKKDVKDKSSCVVAGTSSTTYPSILSTNSSYPSFPSTNSSLPLSTDAYVMGYWSSARLSAGRRDLAAASVGNFALFAGGELSTGLF
jgi:hypothetical protein